MKKVIFSICALSIAFIGSQNIFAADKAAATTKPAVVAEKQSKEIKLNGKLTAVDQAAGTVTIKAKAGEVTVKFDENSKVLKDKATVTKDDVKAGQIVSIVAKDSIIKTIRIIK